MHEHAAQFLFAKFFSVLTRNDYPRIVYARDPRSFYAIGNQQRNIGIYTHSLASILEQPVQYTIVVSIGSSEKTLKLQYIY